MTISGDCSIAGLGLSLTDRQTLISNINVIFHAAATIKFDENLKLAVDINVHGTKDIIQLGKEMTQLKVNIKSLTFIRYLHVSCFLSFSSYFFLLHSKVFKVNYNINATSISYFFSSSSFSLLSVSFMYQRHTQIVISIRWRRNFTITQSDMIIWIISFQNWTHVQLKK